MAETPDTLVVQTETDVFRLTGRPCELSAFSHVPTNRQDVPKERNVFNFDAKEHYPGSRYDRLFYKEEGYNNKLHRCDREHAKSRGLKVNAEEKKKDVPTLNSTIYGHYLDMHVDNPDRQHVRVGHVRSEFYRRNGIPSTTEL